MTSPSFRGEPLEHIPPSVIEHHLKTIKKPETVTVNPDVNPVDPSGIGPVDSGADPLASSLDGRFVKWPEGMKHFRIFADSKQGLKSILDRRTISCIDELGKVDGVCLCVRFTSGEVQMFMGMLVTDDLLDWLNGA